MRALTAVLAVLAGIASSQARIITVDDDGPADFNTIQAAIDDANDGDTVSVATGTYNESIVMKDGVPVHGAGADVTTIDGGGAGHVVTFSFVSATISGFTITGSSPTDHYAGIHVYASHVNVEDNTIVANQKAIRVLGNSNALINANMVIDNSDGIAIVDSNVVISNNLVARNGTWGCGIAFAGGFGAIINNTVTAHSWFALSCSTPASTIDIANNIITHNGYGINVNGWSCDLCSAVPYLDISYNNVWDNYIDYWEHYGDIEWGYHGPFTPLPGTGQISTDPLFAHPDSGDYHVKSQGGRYDPNSRTWVVDDVTSPCIDAGDPMSPIGLEPFPNGAIVNMGAYGGTTEASKSYFGGPPCEIIVAGDVNGDCKVDYRDFQIMALRWLEQR